MRGHIIAMEGIDGSGKSSQAKLLKDWLENKVDTYLTEWNSSDWIHEVIKEAKKKNLLTPLTFSLIHATDFADRYERLILPMYRIGFTVVSDRYFYTAFARDSVRGVNINWVRQLYSYAMKPDVTFFIRVTPEVALARLRENKRGIKPQEAGSDVFPDLDPEEGFLKYQGLVLEMYDKMASEEGFVIIDGNKSPREIQIEIRRKVGEIIWKE